MGTKTGAQNGNLESSRKRAWSLLSIPRQPWLGAAAFQPAPHARSSQKNLFWLCCNAWRHYPAPAPITCQVLRPCRTIPSSPQVAHRAPSSQRRYELDVTLVVKPRFTPLRAPILGTRTSHLVRSPLQSNAPLHDTSAYTIQPRGNLVPTSCACLARTQEQKCDEQVNNTGILQLSRDTTRDVKFLELFRPRLKTGSPVQCQSNGLAAMWKSRIPPLYH